MGTSVPSSKKFTVPTTSQVRREYAVEAKDSDQAHARLRTYLADPDLMKDGIVELIGESNTTDPQVKIAEIAEIKNNGRPRTAPAGGGGEEKS